MIAQSCSFTLPVVKQRKTIKQINGSFLLFDANNELLLQTLIPLS